MRLVRAAAVLLLCLCWGGASAQADQRWSVRAELEVEEVELGRPFSVHLVATHPKGSVVQWPEPLPVGTEFEELSRRVDQRDEGEPWVISEAHVTLMAFDTALRFFPALQIRLVDAGGSLQRIKSQRLPLRVTGLLNAEEPALRPLAQPVDVLVRDNRLLAIVGSVPALLVIVVLILWVSRRRRPVRRTRLARSKARLPAHEEALAKLDALEASGALDAAALKSAYLDMSEIFRDYLGRRFGFSSLDLTTSEIRSRLASVDGSHQWHKSVVAWLSRCDLIKYANSVADPDEAREALYSARVLIERTKEIAQDRPREVARA